MVDNPSAAAFASEPALSASPTEPKVSALSGNDRAQGPQLDERWADIKLALGDMLDEPGAESLKRSLHNALIANRPEYLADIAVFAFRLGQRSNA